MEIDYLNTGRYHSNVAEARFDAVFTKLKAIQMEVFQKIILIDSDLLFTQNADELMRFPTPAGLPRGAAPGRGPNSCVNKRCFDKPDAEKKQVGGINAGVLVLTPNEQSFEDMRYCLRQA